ncbi:helix-turn-helix transcriptional regulator [Lentzea sp. BCCO 10_0798]|uniref:Helix-turn-helix transcriptional regulator n=1 Tax=Lentzea kristufekii TaxID=3095430 RepID=A0ABU4TQ20_9PSEU|nr:helix-turn-helix transcriptional regulator [Lentzea sp. BCCO 10_0798]MDX8050388.1 helix-turn-helix transcriptional regulator [Lentzea sp. BCCO 10_0798]
MTEPASKPRARDLAKALDELVKQHGGVRATARLIGVAHSTVSQWINLRRVPSVDAVAAALQKLGAPEDARERILALARAVAESSYLTTGLPGVSQQLASMLDNERRAVRIFDWSPLLIPGMLQTSRYARAIFGGGGAEVETRVTMRMGRRDALTRPDPVDLVAVIHVAALMQHIGGSSVMPEQLEHLLKMAELPSVSLHAVADETDFHPGLLGPFIFYEFEDEPSTVHLEHHRSGVFLYGEADVDAYRIAAQEVREVAMSAEDTAALIVEILNSKWR